MAVMELENVSKSIIVLADRDGHYATLEKGKTVILDDSLLTKQCVLGPINSGNIRVVKKGKRMPVPKVEKEKASQESISRFSGQESEQSPEGISKFDSEDAIPEAETAPKDNKMEEVGQVIRKRGRKKKLVTIEAPEKEYKVKRKVNPRHLPPHVIPVQGEQGINSPLKDEGAKLILASDIPGKASMIDVDEATWDKLTDLSKQTDAIIDGVGKEKKLTKYGEFTKDQRLMMIERTTDLAFLRDIAKVEWTGEIAKRIRNKIKVLEKAENV